MYCIFCKKDRGDNKKCVICKADISTYAVQLGVTSDLYRQNQIIKDDLTLKFEFLNNIFFESLDNSALLFENYPEVDFPDFLNLHEQIVQSGNLLLEIISQLENLLCSQPEGDPESLICLFSIEEQNLRGLILSFQDHVEQLERGEGPMCDKIQRYIQNQVDCE